MESWKHGRLENWKRSETENHWVLFYPLFHHSNTPLFQTKKGGDKKDEEVRKDAGLAGIRPRNTKHLTLNTIQTQEEKQ
ncbi:MAG TPA: hypothetical protein VMV04_15160 [Thermodesulfobacteriota bacterium]|nr:hypothetical protein [Thermodesulfobacteriota bacterium]